MTTHVLVRPTPDQIEQAWFDLMQGELRVAEHESTQRLLYAMYDHVVQEVHAGVPPLDAAGDPIAHVNAEEVARRLAAAYAALFYPAEKPEPTVKHQLQAVLGMAGWGCADPEDRQADYLSDGYDSPEAALAVAGNALFQRGKQRKARLENLMTSHGIRPGADYQYEHLTAITAHGHHCLRYAALHYDESYSFIYLFATVEEACKHLADVLGEETGGSIDGVIDLDTGAYRKARATVAITLEEAKQLDEAY